MIKQESVKTTTENEVPIEPGRPRDKPNSCDQTEGSVGKVDCQDQKLQG
jgi:hypothetical protein